MILCVIVCVWSPFYLNPPHPHNVFPNAVQDGATRTSTQDKISLLLAQRKLRGVNKEKTEDGEAQDNSHENDEENETQGPTAGDLSDEEGESDMEEGEDDEVEALPLPQPSMQVSAADLDSDAESEADSEAERRKDDFFDSTPEVRAPVVLGVPRRTCGDNDAHLHSPILKPKHLRSARRRAAASRTLA